MLVILAHDPDIPTELAAGAEDGDESMERPDGGSGEEGDSGSEGSSGSEEWEGGDSEGEGEAGEAGRLHPGQGGGKQQKRAAAAVCVGVGSFSDPEDLPGLSHYLEHMLFMGSERFPEENEYDSFLQQNGGSCNAFTDMESTVYYFDVNGDRLRGAMERFAGFFTAPLCLEGSLEREVQAVDNEFSNCLQSDMARLLQLLSSTAAPGHPAGKFTWGNRASLWDTPRASGIRVRERVLEHYRSLYSAERMTLVVVGGNSLDEMQAWAAELFGDTPTGRGPRPTYEAHGRPFVGGPTMFLAPSVRDRHVLEITFPMPSLLKEYR